MRLEDSSNWGYTGKKIKPTKYKGGGGAPAGPGCLVVLMATSLGTWSVFIAERMVF